MRAELIVSILFNQMLIIIYGLPSVPDSQPSSYASRCLPYKCFSLFFLLLNHFTTPFFLL